MQPSKFSGLNTRANRLQLGAAVVVASAALTVLLIAKAAPIFTPDSQPTGWVTRPALSSNNLSSNTEIIYRPGYVAGEWYGVLEANYIDKDAGIGGASPWTNKDAGVLLDSNNYDTGRKIVTVKSDGTKIPFRFASLSLAQQTALGSATTGPKLLNYVRGDRSNEAPATALLRTRKRVLGDIVHSTLVHWNHGSGIRRLYVGANDGMLHAFDAANGQELFAYVPSMLIPKLSQLAINPYARTHYVDGPISSSDVRLGTATRTLLTGGLGAGGKGLYALDVTTTTATATIASESDAASKIKWEISSDTTGFANLGYTYAMPRLARLNNDTAAVVVGNGYMNSGNGHAVLYVINADTGAKIAEIDTGDGSAASPNGLSSPTMVDTNGDGKVDYAYAGDLNGNIWKFDLTSGTPSSFSASKLYTVSPVASITTAPVVQRHPNGGYMVIAGTGRTLQSDDTSDTSVHYVYGIWDGAPAGNSALLAQTLTEATLNGQRLRSASTDRPNWSASTTSTPGHRGWKLTLPAGERVVGEAPFLNDNRFYFTSTNPTISTTSTDGESWVNQVNYLSGGGFASSIFDINNDGLINDSDKVNGQVISSGFIGTGVLSQPVLTDLSVLSLTFYNSNPDQIAPPATTSSDRGVSKGHFDVDIYYYSGSSTIYGNKKHVHEYDDKYNVTGVNMLNASQPLFNISKAITDVNKQFKVLVMNQYLSPAATLSLGGNAYESVKTFGALASATDASALLAALPVYSRSNVASLAFNLPKDAFKSKDWWGDGSAPRAGLIPSQTGCVHGVSSSGASSRNGPNGERYNGALTIQLIRSDTPASALEMNYPGGGAKYGWRVKSANFTTYVLAEWTYFWHHNNGKCYGDAGWVQDPPEDFGASGRALVPASGSTDSVFGADSPVPGTTTPTGGSTTTGPVCVGTSCPCVGTACSGEIKKAEEEIRSGSGRINWREIVRE